MPSATFKITVGYRSQNDGLERFLTSWDKEQAEFSLRAIKKETVDDKGNKQIIYQLFKRNGKESWCERFVNFLYQDTQRENARDAIKMGFSFMDKKSQSEFRSNIDGMERLALGDALRNIVLNREVKFDDLTGATALVDSSRTKPDAVGNPDNGNLNSGNMAITRLAHESDENPLSENTLSQKRLKKNKFSIVSILNCVPLFARGAEQHFSRSVCDVGKSLAVTSKHTQKHKAVAKCAKRISTPEPSGIHVPKEARLNGGIQIKLMESLDVQDLDPSVAVLMRNREEYFDMTEECRAWLRKRKEQLQRDSSEGRSDKYAKIEIDKKIAYLAPHEENKPNQTANKKSIEDFGEIYRKTIDDAVENQQPIVLTPLFRYDEKAINQYITAMLTPIYAHLRANRTLRLEIRTTCRKTVAALKNYQRQYPSSPLKMNGAAVPQIRERLHEKDLTSEGMIMMTPETVFFSSEKAGKMLDAAWQRFIAQPGAESVQPRKSLEENAWARCYFFEEGSAVRNPAATPGARAARKTSEAPSDLWMGTPRKFAGRGVAGIDLEIEANYRAAFKAANDNGCRFLTVPSLEARYGSSLPKEVAAVQIIGILRKLKNEFPAINMTLLSQDPHVRQHFQLLENTA